MYVFLENINIKTNKCREVLFYYFWPLFQSLFDLSYRILYVYFHLLVLGLLPMCSCGSGILVYQCKVPLKTQNK